MIDPKKYVEDFLLYELESEKSKRYIKMERRIIKEFIQYCNNDFSKLKLIEFKQHLQDTHKVSTVNVYIILINKFIKYVEMRESKRKVDKKSIKKYDSELTLNHIRQQKKTNVDNVISEAAYKRMLRKAKENGYHDLWMLMKIIYHSGVRISELKFFTVENLEKAKSITIYNKGKSRDVPLSPKLLKEIKSHCKANGITAGSVIPTYISSKGLIDDKKVRTHLKRIAGICRGIPLKSVYPHSFRHLFAIRWVEENGASSIGELAAILGHSDINTTVIYTQTSLDQKRQKLNKI